MRMNEREKAAACRELTVPMILFFCRACSSSFSDRPTSKIQMMP